MQAKPTDLAMDGVIYYVDNDITQHRNDVAIFVASVKYITPFSDRMLLMQLRAYPLGVNIIKVFAPMADKNDLIIKVYLQQLDTG